MAKDATMGDNSGITFDQQVLDALVIEYEEFESDKKSVMGKAMSECKEIGKSQKEVVTRAKEAGFKPKLFRAIIKEREARRKVDEIAAEFEEDDKQTYDQMRLGLGMLGELPLGQAALDKKAKQDGLDSLAAG